MSDLLHLPDVTLCCVDTRSVPQALHALRRCMDQVRFGRVLFLGPQRDAERHPLTEGVDWVPIPELKGIEDYNRIMLRELAAHIHTSHVLIVQWDGFITHPQLWRPDFLSVDYIGPPWYHGGHPGMVGNGGFSLRSRRLLDALASLHDLDTRQPEDMVICVERRAELEQKHAIRFATLEMAQDFGCEYGDYRPSFGFHGMHNFARVLDERELAEWLNSAPQAIIVHQHARKLVKSLMACGRVTESVQLLRLRARHLGWTWDHCMLLLRAHASRLRSRDVKLTSAAP